MTPPAARAPDDDPFWGRTLRVAGWSVALGIALQIVQLVLRAQPTTSTTALAGRGIFEVLFPIGCAAVVYVTERAGRLARGTT